MTKQNSIQLILFLLDNLTARRCPPNKLLDVEEKDLEQLVIENKCLPCLFHLADCQNCQRHFSNQFMKRIKNYYSQSIHQALFYEQQKKQIGAEFQKNNFSFCFLKDFNSYPKIAHHRQYFWGTDLDILIAPENFLLAERVLNKLKYRKVKVHEHEAVFKRNTGLEVDLHSLPCDFSVDFPLIPLQELQQLSKIILNKTKSKKGRTSNEALLLFLITHFWINDCLKRIRSLFDIAIFIKKYSRKINWQKFIAMSEKIHFLPQTIFIIAMCSQQFSSPLPDQLKRIKKSFSFTSLLRYHNSKRVMIFPPTLQWWKPNNPESQRMHADCYLTSQLLLQTSIFNIVLKPRTILFFLKTLFH